MDKEFRAVHDHWSCTSISRKLIQLDIICFTQNIGIQYHWCPRPCKICRNIQKGLGTWGFSAVLYSTKHARDNDQLELVASRNPLWVCYLPDPGEATWMGAVRHSSCHIYFYALIAWIHVVIWFVNAELLGDMSYKHGKTRALFLNI